MSLYIVAIFMHLTWSGVKVSQLSLKIKNKKEAGWAKFEMFIQADG